jgi:hypothetical protein
MKVSEMIGSSRAKGACEDTLRPIAECETWEEVAASPGTLKWLQWAAKAELLPDACAPVLAEYEVVHADLMVRYETTLAPSRARYSAAFIVSQRDDSPDLAPARSLYMAICRFMDAEFNEATATAAAECVAKCLETLKAQ